MRTRELSAIALAAGLLIAAPASAQSGYYRSGEQPQNQQRAQQDWEREQMRQREMQRRNQQGVVSNPDRSPYSTGDRRDVSRQQDRFRDRNPYGVGSDVQDDKWDTGFWDMGEYDAPQNRQRVQGDRRWGGLMSGDRDDRNPYGIGDDIFDDKWDTGLGDMGEYNAWDYPEEYQRDLQALREGRFHQQYGVRPDRDRSRGLRDDDVWSGDQPWYRDSTRRTERDGDRWGGLIPWGGPNDRTAERRDRVRVPVRTARAADDQDRQNRLRLGEATRNPYGVGEDVFDDKWDTGLWDMGEHNAWDYPQQYQRDVQRLDRGQFHQQYGVSPDQDSRRAREGLRDDDIWDGRQPWFRDSGRDLRSRYW